MSRKMKDSGIEWIGEIPEEWKVRKLKTIASIMTGNTPSKTNNDLYYSDEGVMWIKPDNLNEYIPVSNTKEKLNEKGVEVARIAKSGSTLVCCIGSIGKFGIIDEDSAFNQQINAVTFFENICNEKYGTYLIAVSEDQHWFYSNGNVLKILNNENQGKILLPLPPLLEQQKIVNFLDEKVKKIDNIIDKTKESIKEYKKYKQAIITEAVTKGLDPDVEMKDSGIEWIAKIPKNWEIFKIKYVAELNPKIDVTKIQDNSIVTFTPMDKIKNGYYIQNEGLWGNYSSSYTLYQEGDIVIAKVTPCFENGNIAIMEGLTGGIGYGSSELFVIRPNKKILNTYLMYYLCNNYFKDLGKSTMTGAGGLKRVSSDFIKEHIIPLPNIKEQFEIVDYLDEKYRKIDDLIKKKEVFIKELENYKKSLIYEYVTGKKEVK